MSTSTSDASDSAASRTDTGTEYRRDNWWFDETDGGDVDAEPDDTDDAEAEGKDAWKYRGGHEHDRPNPNDPVAAKAHELLRAASPPLCAATLLGDPAPEGGRTAILSAFLFESEPVGTERAWATHTRKRRDELSDPELHIPKNASDTFGTPEHGQHRHRRRVNPETGYITAGETTAVWIQDVSFSEFMAVVDAYIHEVNLPPKKRRDVRATARGLKRAGDGRDVDLLTHVVQLVREKRAE